jgi:hypothetical protein
MGCGTCRTENASGLNDMINPPPGGRASRSGLQGFVPFADGERFFPMKGT